MHTKGRLRGAAFVLPGLLGVAIFFVVPFIASLRYVFTQGYVDMRIVGLQNLIELFTNPAFLLAVRNTAIFAAVGVPFVTLGALMISLALAMYPHRFARFAMLTPMMVPVASALMGWDAVFGAGGLLSSLAENADGYWQDPTARWVMLLVFVVKNLGYMVIIFSGALAGMPKEYKEVFSLDSRSLFSYARRVIIPLLTPVIFFVVILSLINCFQIYREVFGLYGQYPPNSLYMLQNFMNNNFLKLNYHRLCSASFLVTMTIGLVVAVYLRVQDRSKRR